MKRSGVIVIVLFTTLLLGVQTISACLCAFPGPTAAEEFDTSAAVGVFSVVSVDDRAVRMGASGANLEFVTATKVTLAADKVYKGKIEKGEMITLEQQAFNSCSISFHGAKRGTEYLLYLRTGPKGEKTWGVAACTRSGAAKDAAGDLLYLDNLEKRKGQTRLSGKVTRLFESDAKGTTRREPVANSPIEISGNGATVRVETDGNGVFEVYGLAPGVYKVAPAKIEGYDFAGSDRAAYTEVEIIAGRQIERDFSFFSK